MPSAPPKSAVRTTSRSLRQVMRASPESRSKVSSPSGSSSVETRSDEVIPFMHVAASSIANGKRSRRVQIWCTLCSSNVQRRVDCSCAVGEELGCGRRIERLDRLGHFSVLGAQPLAAGGKNTHPARVTDDLIDDARELLRGGARSCQVPARDGDSRVDRRVGRRVDRRRSVGRNRARRLRRPPRG